MLLLNYVYFFPVRTSSWLDTYQFANYIFVYMYRLSYYFCSSLWWFFAILSLLQTYIFRFLPKCPLVSSSRSERKNPLTQKDILIFEYVPHFKRYLMLLKLLSQKQLSQTDYPACYKSMPSMNLTYPKHKSPLTKYFLYMQGTIWTD